MNKEQKPQEKINIIIAAIVVIVLLLITPRIGYFIEHYFLGRHKLEYIHFFDIVAEAVKTCIEIAILIWSIKNRKFIKKLCNTLKRFVYPRYESTGDEFPLLDGKVKAIVIPVSRTQQPMWIINYVKPEYVSLIYTSSLDSKEATKEIIRKFSNKVNFNLTEQDVYEEKYMIKEPDNPKHTKIRVKHFIEEFLDKGIDKKNIFVDTTGGKVPMSIGAFQAAEEMGVSSIYVVGRGDKGLIDPEYKDSGYPIYLSEKK